MLWQWLINWEKKVSTAIMFNTRSVWISKISLIWHVSKPRWSVRFCLSKYMQGSLQKKRTWQISILMCWARSIWKWIQNIFFFIWMSVFYLFASHAWLHSLHERSSHAVFSFLFLFRGGGSETLLLFNFKCRCDCGTKWASRQRVTSLTPTLDTCGQGFRGARQLILRSP